MLEAVAVAGADDEFVKEMGLAVGRDEEEGGVEVGVGRVDGEPEGEVDVAGDLGGFGEGCGVEDEAVAVEVGAGLVVAGVGVTDFVGGAEVVGVGEEGGAGGVGVRGCE